jgi:hypothetical protein
MTDDVKKLLRMLTPDQQAFAKSVATMKLENDTLRAQLAQLKPEYDELWKVMIVVLHAQPDKALRIHKSQFLRFKEEYRVDRTYDKETGEVVLRLLTVHDKPTKGD